MKTLSVIVPAYNEEKNIRPFYDAFKGVFQSLESKYQYELIFVNDGSADHTDDEIGKIVATDDRVRYIDFSRNFGKEIATTAGINLCSGDACMILDADLQHPVELIPDFVKKWEEGFEVVVGIREKSKSDSWIKILGGIEFIDDDPVEQPEIGRVGDDLRIGNLIE